MGKIYRVSDRIKVKVDGLVVEISPLTFEQKINVQAEVLKGDPMSAMRGAALAVKYALKGLSGLTCPDGSEYELEFAGGALTDQCLDDLFNLKESEKLALISLNLLQSVPSAFVDPNTGEKIEGVSIVKESGGKKS